MPTEPPNDQAGSVDQAGSAVSEEVNGEGNSDDGQNESAGIAGPKWISIAIGYALIVIGVLLTVAAAALPELSKGLRILVVGIGGVTGGLGLWWVGRKLPAIQTDRSPPPDPEQNRSLAANLVQAAGIGILLICVVTGAAWTYERLADELVEREPCPVPGDPSVSVPEPIVVDVGDQVLHIRFGQSRASQVDEVRLGLPADIPADVVGVVSAHSTTLMADGPTIAGDEIVVTAQVSRGSLTVVACVAAIDAEGKPKLLQSGIYTGSVQIDDPAFAPTSIPLTVSIQARYLWPVGLAALITFPFIGLWLAGVSFVGNRALLRDRTKQLIVAGTATATVFGAQGLSNEGWGGVTATLALLAAMYLAATGAAMTAVTTTRDGSIQNESNQPQPDASTGLPRR